MMTDVLMNYETSFMVIGMFVDAGSIENTRSMRGTLPDEQQ